MKNDDILKKVNNSKDKVSALNVNKKLLNTIVVMNDICEDLCTNTNEYDVDTTIKIIEDYIKNDDKVERILYSEVSSILYSLDEVRMGLFSTNIEKLMVFILNRKSVGADVDCDKIIIKIYDHFQLIMRQAENVEKSMYIGFKESADKFRSEIKIVEREYISILGIFAAIVLTFVGGITFSSAVLQSMFAVSMYRLITVTILLAFVMVNVIWLLINFILTINDKNTKTFKLNIMVFDIGCAIACVGVMLYWLLFRG